MTRKIDKIIIHSSATPPNMYVDAQMIREWHLERRWSDIGYHDVICRDGRIEEGRPLDKAGAHTKGYNANSIGVCLVGGVDDNNNPEMNFTAQQLRALRRLLKAYQVQFPQATVHGHNEFSSTACPSFNVQEWLNANT